jgi:hypothetical protein
MTARILKSLTLALVLGGIFAASASAMQIAEPSIYSARISKPSAAPVAPIVSEKVAGLQAQSTRYHRAIVSEKVAGLQAAVPTAVFSDRGVLTAQDSGLVPTLAVSDRGVLTAKDAGLQSQSPQVLASSGDGFNWGDASIGAGVTFTALLLLTGVALTGRRHRPIAH